MAQTEMATVGEVAKFFGVKSGGFKAFGEEWKLLTDEAKQQIRTGIKNGTLTY